jgi:hypothetical protein
VPKERLRRLVLKELADNSLDTGADVRVGELDGGSYFVEDDGNGIDPEEVTRLFSISRRSRQWAARRRRRGAGFRGIARRHHPQSTSRSAP